MQFSIAYMTGAMALVLAGAITLGAQPPPSGPDTAPAPQPTLNTYIDAVRTATDPPSAVEAYSRGLALDSRSVALDEAYIRRMAAFGMPQMVTRTAASLAEIQPGNGLAAAALAYNSARQGDISSAFSHIAQAVKSAPEEPFVQTTAGQLVAWYDHNQHRENITTAMKTASDQARQTLAGRGAFSGAYRQTVAALKAQVAKNNADTAPPMPLPHEYTSDGSEYSYQSPLSEVYPNSTYSAPSYGGYAYPPYRYPNYPYTAYGDYPLYGLYPYYNYGYYGYYGPGYSPFLPYFFFRYRPRPWDLYGRYHSYGRFPFGRGQSWNGNWSNPPSSGSIDRPFSTGRTLGARRFLTPNGTITAPSRLGRGPGTVSPGMRAWGNRTFATQPRSFGRHRTAEPRPNR